MSVRKTAKLLQNIREIWSNLLVFYILFIVKESV